MQPVTSGKRAHVRRTYASERLTALCSCKQLPSEGAAAHRQGKQYINREADRLLPLLDSNAKLLQLDCTTKHIVLAALETFCGHRRRSQHPLNLAFPVMHPRRLQCTLQARLVTACQPQRPVHGILLAGHRSKGCQDLGIDLTM